jgi:hypothetical protein
MDELEGTPEEAVDLAYELYQALDNIMWRSDQLPRGESEPAKKAMAAYEAWESKRQEKYMRGIRE